MWGDGQNLEGGEVRVGGEWSGVRREGRCMHCRTQVGEVLGFKGAELRGESSLCRAAVMGVGVPVTGKRQGVPVPLQGSSLRLEWCMEVCLEGRRGGSRKGLEAKCDLCSREDERYSDWASSGPH